MPSDAFTPAAQYVRMSTEHQQYSIANQQAAIAQYAAVRNFEIVKTYQDAGKSGLNIKHREGLRQLLDDVIRGGVPYRAILVYDISRWGRFQDLDEAAHYEFLCKSSGIRVHYCAELFDCNDTPMTLLLKAMKRAMAGEFSRELGVKVFDGQRRLAAMGYWMGARAVYGLRRVIISGEGRRKEQMASGEQKSTSTDRVILILGPKSEVACVRKMYAMYAAGLGPSAIAREMNTQNAGRAVGRTWTRHSVVKLLENPLYVGTYVWGRTAHRLQQQVVRVPRSQWTIVPDAFEPVVDRQTFRRVQAIRRECIARTHARPAAQFKVELRVAIVEEVRRLWRETGALSERAIRESNIAGRSSIARWFGSFGRLYEMLGYKPKREVTESVQHSSDVRRLRRSLLHALTIQHFSGRVTEFCPLTRTPSGRERTMLMLDNEVIVSVLTCRPRRSSTPPSWIAMPVQGERQFITLLCAINLTYTDFSAFYLLPSLEITTPHILRDDAAWLSAAHKLNSLSEFYQVAWEIAESTTKRCQ